MNPSRDEIAAAIRAADVGGPGSTVDHEEAAENVLALLSQAGGSGSSELRRLAAIALDALEPGELGRLRDRRGVLDAEQLERQWAWSLRTFGPGRRVAALLDHLRRELVEIEENPGDLLEWVDVVLLAFDGAMRAGHEPAAVLDAVRAKQAANEARAWPDWRTVDTSRAIEHVRTAENP